MATIQKIRQKIIDRAYYLSSHAEDELAADGFERADVEHAIFKGRIEKKLTHDERGARYRVEGLVITQIFARWMPRPCAGEVHASCYKARSPVPGCPGLVPGRFTFLANSWM